MCIWNVHFNQIWNLCAKVNPNVFPLMVLAWVLITWIIVLQYCSTILQYIDAVAVVLFQAVWPLHYHYTDLGIPTLILFESQSIQLQRQASFRHINNISVFCYSRRTECLSQRLRDQKRTAESVKQREGHQKSAHQSQRFRLVPHCQIKPIPSEDRSQNVRNP